MTKEERAELIAAYAAGADEVEAALAMLPREHWTARPFPGKWSAAEIVHHLADSEMTSAVRLRRLLVEDEPAIQGYDPDLFAVKLGYNERPVEPALEALRGARAVTVSLLAMLTEADWQRAGMHSEHGSYAVEGWLRIYAEHARKHAGQIRRLAEAVMTGGDVCERID